jgi:xylitol oxidase
MTEYQKTGEKNWAGNVEYSSRRISAPTSQQEIREAFVTGEQVKALGTRHSFSSIADTRGIHITTREFGQGVSIDPNRSTVTVDSGVRYGELAHVLWEHGYALHNLASLPHISVVGACATGTHGSGDRNGSLATSVQSFDIVTGSGELRTCSREHSPATFDGMVVHLGALGVVTSITLQIVPRFLVTQTVYEDLPVAELYSHFDAVTGSAYSVSLFTDWRAPVVNQVWRKQKTESPYSVEPEREFYGARPAPGQVHPVAGVSAESCSVQQGIPGPWHERLPHFKLSHTPSVGEELQSEYFVRREHAVEAFRRLEKLRQHISPLLMISEIRTVAADSLWLSPCHRGASVGFHFTWRREPHKVLAVLPIIEQALRDLDPIPHWGKVFTLSGAELETRYSRLQDFRALVREFDPHGRCTNDFLKRWVLG